MSDQDKNQQTADERYVETKNLDVQTGEELAEGQKGEIGCVRVIRLTRVAAHNSIDKGLRLALREAFEKTAEDDSVRAVVVEAEGPTFCVGQDLKEHLVDLKNRQGMGKVVDEYNPMVAALLSIPVPVVAAISGPAAGAGWSLALNCDFRVASAKAKFKSAFTGVGLASDCGLSRTLTEIVGPAKALELLLIDEGIGAAEAKELGLVTSVVSDERAEDAARAFALKLAKGPTRSYAEIKALVRDAGAISAAADREAAAQERLAATADHMEAVQSFLEKRAPRFIGK